jgi:hypothetical protein
MAAPSRHAPLWLLSASLVGAVASFSASTTAQTFTDVTASSGLALPGDVTLFGTGMCVADFDGDGDLDLVTADRPNFSMRFWRNDGNLQFSDRTGSVGFPPTMPVVHGLTPADVDNDGDQDLFVCCWYAPPMLFINDGSARFTEDATNRGLLSSTSKFVAAFGDYDRDGWLDMYVGNRATPPTTPSAEVANELFRNTGGGSFTDVSLASGTAVSGLTFAATFMDYNEDLWPDIAVANDKGSSFSPNSMFRNDGNGSFTSIGPAINADIPIDGMGIDFVDAFNDGGWDIYCSDIPPDHLFLVWNPTSNRYVEAQATYGVASGDVGWAVNFADFDNDGWQDLYVVQLGAANALYKNPGAPAAAQVAWPDVATGAVADAVGNPGIDQFTALIADLDNDGDLDIVQRHVAGASAGITIQRNDTTGSNWLKFQLEGVVSNRDGLGAEIRVLANGVQQRQAHRSAVGFQCSSDPRPHFGLGAATVADRVEVIWPSGRRQVLRQVASNQLLQLREPHLSVGTSPTVGTSCPIDLDIQGAGGTGYVVALAFAPGSTTIGSYDLPLANDALLSASLSPNNGFLTNSIGVMPASGQVSATLAIPASPSLIGASVYAHAVTVDPAGSPLLRSSFPEPLAITFQ